MKKAIGVAMLAAPIVALLILFAHVEGVRTVFLVFGAIGFFIVYFATAANLIDPQGDW